MAQFEGQKLLCHSFCVTEWDCAGPILIPGTPPPPQHPGNNVFALPFDDASRAPRTSPGPQRNTFSLNPTSTIIIPVLEGDCGSERLRDCPKVTQHMSSIYKNMNQLTEHFLLSFGLSIHPSGGKKISWYVL